MWLFAMAPLLGIAIFYYFVPQSVVQRGAPRLHSGTQEGSGMPLRPDFPDSNLLRHRNEVEAKINESMARMAKTMTPKRQSQLIDRLMLDREPRYRALFESWHLDSTTADEALTIVREGEALKFNALQELNQQGTSGRQAFGETLTVGREFVDIQLGLLLGEERFQEFSRLEAEMERDMHERARKAIIPD